MRKIYGVFCAVLASIAVLSGCSPDKKTDKNVWDVTGVQPEYVSKCQDNEFTRMIILPADGEIESVTDYSSQGRYMIDWKGIERDESRKYIKELKKQGYKQKAYNENKASGGVVMQRDTTVLSIAFSGDGLSILISDTSIVQ